MTSKPDPIKTKKKHARKKNSSREWDFCLGNLATFWFGEIWDRWANFLATGLWLVSGPLMANQSPANKIKKENTALDDDCRWKQKNEDIASSSHCPFLFTEWIWTLRVAAISNWLEHQARPSVSDCLSRRRVDVVIDQSKANSRDPIGLDFFSGKSNLLAPLKNEEVSHRVLFLFCYFFFFGACQSRLASTRDFTFDSPLKKKAFHPSNSIRFQLDLH